ncbi:MAG: glycerol-3-phosphate 1-O-acyltransferase PlsY [Desulfohalobiaceae bacterium]|nr:glycerol-3-phosphate 1-O-acyltransferase PlsY [Desulfohalobiaceae bacterium]
MAQFFALLGWLIVVYIVGSVPFGLLLAKIGRGIDPRLHGSRNTGATNVARTCGTRYAVATLILDLSKGFIPMLAATAISHSPLLLTLTGLAALLGHMYSLFLDGRGGKGVATTIGIFLAVTPTPLIWSLILCVILIWTIGYVSLGSLALVASLPLFLLLAGDFGFLLLGIVVTVLVFGKHRENILRLARGEEKTWKRSEAGETT